MDYFEFYKTAYNYLGDSTPMYFDCGQLCNRKCCENNGLGMIAFPHETDYLKTLDQDYTFKNSNKVNMIYCNGSCNRHVRPLSCIIFPLFPYLYEDGRLDLKIDIRSKNMCPLYYQDIEELKLHPLFRLKLFKFFEEAIKDKEINYFLKALTVELIEIERFKK